jgi:hypothetical protein
VSTGTRPLRFAMRRWHRFRELQALEDAINYRMARLAVPCLRCQPVEAGGQCDEHACDVALIAGYLRVAQATMAELVRLAQDMRQGVTDRVPKQ